MSARPQEIGAYAEQLMHYVRLSAYSKPHRPRRFVSVQTDQKFLSISQLAERWRCSRGTVYNRLRAVGAKVLDFAPRGKRGRKVVSMDVVLQIEGQNTKRLW